MSTQTIPFLMYTPHPRISHSGVHSWQRWKLKLRDSPACQRWAKDPWIMLKASKIILESLKGIPGVPNPTCYFLWLVFVSSHG